MTLLKRLCILDSLNSMFIVRILKILTILTAAMSSVTAQNRTILPGTKISMEPPADFTPATSFSGYQQASTNSSVMISVMQGPFNQIAASLTSENMKKVGVTIISKRDTIHGGYKAIWITGSQTAYGQDYGKAMLVFGDDSKTVLVNIAYPKSNRELAIPLHQSAFSVMYNSQQESKPEDAVAFQIDTVGTDYELRPVLNAMLFYVPKGSPEKSGVYFIAASSVGKSLVQDQKNFAEERLRKLPGHADDQMLSSSIIEIDGLSGFEVLSEGKNEQNQKEITLLVVLYLPENGGYYVLTGIADQDYDKNLQAFKRLAGSFRRK